MFSPLKKGFFVLYYRLIRSSFSNHTEVKMSETIIVLDFGSQYSQLIARRVRECNVYSKIMPYNTSAAVLREENPRGIILSGGPSSVYADHAPKCDPAIFDLGIPILGICYGLQLMIHTLGGEITRGKAREYGKAMLKIERSGDLFDGLPGEIQVWMSHGDKVTRMPEGGFEILGSSGNTEYCAVRLGGRKLYGIQFHPEVVHTPCGRDILGNFCRRICGCSGDWTMESFIEQQIREIREKVGDTAVHVDFYRRYRNLPTHVLCMEHLQGLLSFPVHSGRKSVSHRRPTIHARCKAQPLL